MYGRPWQGPAVYVQGREARADSFQMIWHECQLDLLKSWTTMKLSSHIWKFTKLISSFHFSLIKGGISGTLIPWSIDRACFFPTCKGGWQRPIRALGHWPWLWKTLLGGDLMRESLSCSRIEEPEQIHKGQLEADMWKERTSNVA